MTSAADDQRKQDVRTAVNLLRASGAGDPAETLKLAKRLKNVNEFSLARRLYGRLRSGANVHLGNLNRVFLAQQHALCTYKDPDLPAGDRFKLALEILAEADALVSTPGNDVHDKQETLGLRGGVYKRRWQTTGQRVDLDASLHCYEQGRLLGPETDNGYTAINAAFVHDLLAREGGYATSGGMEHAKAARAIRDELIAVLPPYLDRPDKKKDLEGAWWFYATVAEAHTGLGDFEKAVIWLQGYNKAKGIPAGTPPSSLVSPWELETTVTQLVTLVALQADREALMQKDPSLATTIRAHGRAVFAGYIGLNGVDRAFLGKVGLALSGGGFRASLFHVGVLAHLAERDILRHLEVLSCVSGGSIVGAHYYLELQHLLRTNSDSMDRQQYIDLVHRLEKNFLAGVQTNIRTLTLASFWANLRAFFMPGYTLTRRLGDLYERNLYSLVEDDNKGKPRYLRDLIVTPRDEDKNSFRPKYDNWRRRDKVPILVLNATTLNTGHNWQFTASWMGEPPSSLDEEIEGNYRLRRMYHSEAPGVLRKWLGFIRSPDYQRLRLGEAVAASSAVPGIFDPIVMTDLYDGKTVQLVDGGVYDNQGVAGLLDQDCSVMLVSDASGQMETVDHPPSSRIGVPLRSFSVSMERVRQAEYHELDARRKSGLLKDLRFLHLKKNLHADPVDWRDCLDRWKASDRSRPAEDYGPRTKYEMPREIQGLLAGIRTDLDSFTEVEAFSLMLSGYRMAEWEFRSMSGFEAPIDPRPPWRFLDIGEVFDEGRGPAYEEAKRQLGIGRQTLGKVWRLSLPLTVIGLVLAVGALGAGMWWLWSAADRPLVTVHGLRDFMIGLILTVAIPIAVRVIRYRQTLQDMGLRSLIAAGGALLFRIHLLVFDRMFLSLGKVKRVLDTQSE